MHFTFTTDEAGCIENALDLYPRIWLGQYDHIESDMRWQKDCTELDNAGTATQVNFMCIRSILLPELQRYGYNGSHGIYSPTRDFRAGAAYDIIQEMRFKIAWFEHPEGGNTVNFNTPLRSEDDPYPSINARCRIRDGKTILDMDAVPEQIDIMITALKVKDAENHSDIRTIFSFYTDNSDALGYAEEAANIYKTIPDDERFVKDSKMISSLIIRLEDSIEQRTKDKGERLFLRCPFADVDVMILDAINDTNRVMCPICHEEHFLPHDDAGRKRIWHRNRNMFMEIDYGEDRRFNG